MSETGISTVTVDFTRKLGKIKPMNAGNNGPKIPPPSQTKGNFETFRMLHIPYARLHDANLCTLYGAPHVVDIRAIFKDFNADPEDPASYDFTMTDIYLETLKKAGTEPFFRLGGSIEHSPRKWFTCVPPDFRKFAVICEHIIRHCTGSWANGLGMKITYWEIWNEPDLDPDVCENKRCWQGTAAEFRELFCITAKHLKSCFPELKIGGPASASPISRKTKPGWTDLFFAELEKQQIKLDFYSFHCYACDLNVFFHNVREVREYLDTHGQPQAESILNEWNYVRNWNDGWTHTLEQEAGIKGASFALCAMLGCQKLPLDLLMYYDMRVGCGMNGLWHAVTLNIQKPYYSYFMFEKLARLGTEVASDSDDETIQVVGATNEAGKKTAVIGGFNDDDNFGVRKLEIKLTGLTAQEKENLTVRLLDEKLDCFEVPFYLEGDTLRFKFPIRTCFGLLIQC